MTWFIRLRQWEKRALKRHKNNIENNKPGFLEIKAELKADLPAQPGLLRPGTTICWNLLLRLSPSFHLGLCKMELKKKIRFLPKFSLFCPFQRRDARLECETRRKTGLQRKKESDQKCYGLSGSLPGFFPPQQYFSGMSIARGQKGSDTAPAHVGLQHP